MKEPKHPRTAQEWQDCIDGCHACFILDSMWQYGLITPKPKINMLRCQWLFNVGKHKGYEPIYENVLGILSEMINMRKE